MVAMYEENKCKEESVTDISVSIFISYDPTSIREVSKIIIIPDVVMMLTGCCK